LKTIMECVLLCAQSRQAEYVRLTTSQGGSGRELSGPSSIFDLRAFATNAAC
jgi:hypothetical protein